MNVTLYELRNSRKLNCKAMATFVRGELAAALRRAPYQVNVLQAGMDGNTPSLYHIDYLGAMAKIEKGAHGYSAYFLTGILDRYWHPEFTREEAKDLAQKCIDEMRKRFIISMPNFIIKIVDSNGIQEFCRSNNWGNLE